MGLKTRIRKMLGQRPTVVPPAVPTEETLATQYPDIPSRWRDTFLKVRPYTMTSPERVFAVCQAVEHVLGQGIEGSFVECGVWRGGSTMAMLQTAIASGARDRHVWLYDTFEGMSEPGKSDVDCFGHSASQLLDATTDRTSNQSVWCEASLEDVQQNVGQCHYPDSALHYVQGKVEETLPGTIPDSIALLRLDTDWYESTWHELVHLYPRLSSGGVLIIDDYGHWQGCRDAVDQYLAQEAPGLFLHRIDYTGRIAIKP